MNKIKVKTIKHPKSKKYLSSKSIEYDSLGARYFNIIKEKVKDE